LLVGEVGTLFLNSPYLPEDLLLRTPRLGGKRLGICERREIGGDIIEERVNICKALDQVWLWDAGMKHLHE
jgi:hypothetical protein